MVRRITPLNEIPAFVMGVIYIATNLVTQLQYVGQTRTHILNHGKWRKFGADRRWSQHWSEAMGQYQHQSMKLNNAIRKYNNPDQWDVLVLEICPLDKLNERETHYINEFNTVAEGYNLTYGGGQKTLDEAGRRKVCQTQINVAKQQKIDKFRDVPISGIKATVITALDKQIASLNVMHERAGAPHTTKVDFGGKLCPLNESVQRAKDFIRDIGFTGKVELTDRITPHW